MVDVNIATSTSGSEFSKLRSMPQELGSGAFDPFAQLSECRSGRGSRHGTDESHHSVSSDDVRVGEVSFG